MSEENECLIREFKTLCEAYGYDGGMAILFKVQEKKKDVVSTRIIWSGCNEMTGVRLAKCAKEFFLKRIEG